MDMLHYILLGTTAIGAIAAMAYGYQVRNAEEELRTEVANHSSSVANLNSAIERHLAEISKDAKIILDLTAERNEFQKRLEDLQLQYNALGQAETDTNSKLYAFGKVIAKLQTAIKAARNAGKVSPNQRKELNTAVDAALDEAVSTYPKKVEITAESPTPKSQTR